MLLEFAVGRMILPSHHVRSSDSVSPKSARKHGKVMLGWIFSGHFGWRGGFN
jgi:hypothetical protein